MGKKTPRIFLDTSAIFAAVLSETGGARKLFLLAELELLDLVIGPSVLQECEAVARRKAPGPLPILARLLDLGRVETGAHAGRTALETGAGLVAYRPDARVLAEGIVAASDWFITHDKAHFLKTSLEGELPFRIGTPGDLIQALSDGFSQE